MDTNVAASKLQGPSWLHEHLPKLLEQLHLSYAGIASLTVTQDDPQRPTPHRLGAAMALALAAQAAAISELWVLQGGVAQDISLDIADVVATVFPEHTGLVTCRGQRYPSALVRSNPLLDRVWRTGCGHHFFAASLYPADLLAWLKFLNCSPAVSAIETAISGWGGPELEQAAYAQGLPGTLCRTPAAWAHHPQGRLEAASPWVSVEQTSQQSRLVELTPTTSHMGQARPLGNLKVIAFCRALAGPLVGRSLAEQGAQVVHIVHPESFEHDAIHFEVGINSRSVALDLNQDHARGQAKDLVAQADVVIDNLRPGALGRLGLDEQHQTNPQVWVRIDAHSPQGPWGQRPGFDMNALAASGMAYSEGRYDPIGQSVPKLPPTRLFNDYMAAALATAGTVSALVRQTCYGGSYRVQASLTRAAAVCQALGLLKKPLCPSPIKVPHPKLRFSTPWGEMLRYGPPVKMSHTPPMWDQPTLHPRGATHVERAF